MDGALSIVSGSAYNDTVRLYVVLLLVSSGIFAQSIATLRIEGTGADLLRFGELRTVYGETALISYDKVYSADRSHVIIPDGPSITVHTGSEFLLIEAGPGRIELYLFVGSLDVDTHADLESPQQSERYGIVLEVITINGRVSSLYGRLSIDAGHPYHSLVVPTEITETVHYANALFTHSQSPEDRAVLSSSICLQAIFLGRVRRIATLTPQVPALDRRSYIREQVFVYDELTRARYAMIESLYTDALFSASYALQFGLPVPDAAQQALANVDSKLLREHTIALAFYTAAAERLTEEDLSATKSTPLEKEARSHQSRDLQLNLVQIKSLIINGLRTAQIIALSASP